MLVVITAMITIRIKQYTANHSKYTYTTIMSISRIATIM